MQYGCDGTLYTYVQYIDLSSQIDPCQKVSHHAHSLVLQGELSAARRVLWDKLFADISQFDDYRQFNAESGGSGPDFRLKETGAGIW